MANVLMTCDSCRIMGQQGDVTVPVDGVRTVRNEDVFVVVALCPACGELISCELDCGHQAVEALVRSGARELGAAGARRMWVDDAGLARALASWGA